MRSTKEFGSVYFHLSTEALKNKIQLCNSAFSTEKTVSEITNQKFLSNLSLTHWHKNAHQLSVLLSILFIFTCLIRLLSYYYSFSIFFCIFGSSNSTSHYKPWIEVDVARQRLPSLNANPSQQVYVMSWSIHCHLDPTTDSRSNFVMFVLSCLEAQVGGFNMSAHFLKSEREVSRRKVKWLSNSCLLW